MAADTGGSHTRDDRAIRLDAAAFAFGTMFGFGTAFAFGTTGACGI